MSKKQPLPADPRFKGATPAKLVLALRLPKKAKPKKQETVKD